jgi:hypothetical protein
MSGYQVVLDKISNTGRAATRVADGLRGIDCSAALPGGDIGMPGARCVPKLAAVKQAWHGREAGFVGRLDAHAADMARAVQLYAGHEDAAKQDLVPTEQPTSGPRPV